MRGAFRHSTEVQTVIFDVSMFTPASARAWARKHGFVAPKVDVTDRYIRLRQREPSAYRRGTFRTITLTDGVLAVVGVPKAGGNLKPRQNTGRVTRLSGWEKIPFHRVPTYDPGSLGAVRYARVNVDGLATGLPFVEVSYRPGHGVSWSVYPENKFHTAVSVEAAKEAADAKALSLGYVLPRQNTGRAGKDKWHGRTAYLIDFSTGRVVRKATPAERAASEAQIARDGIGIIVIDGREYITDTDTFQNPARHNTGAGAHFEDARAAVRRALAARGAPDYRTRYAEAARALALAERHREQTAPFATARRNTGSGPEFVPFGVRDPRDGWKVDGSKVAFWGNKKDAESVARALRWPLAGVTKAHTRFQNGYAICDEDKGFLSVDYFANKVAQLPDNIRNTLPLGTLRSRLERIEYERGRTNPARTASGSTRPTRTAQVSAYLAAHGLPGVTLHKGPGYLYFSGEQTLDWPETGVMVYRVSDLPLAGWLSEARALAAKAR